MESSLSAIKDAKIREFISEEAIAKKVKEMGKQISEDYRGREPLHVVGALKGCFIFMADLIRHIEIPVEVDFLEVSSYGDSTESSGNVKIIKDLTQDIAGRHLLLAEDIIDTGLTINRLLDMLSAREPASIHIATLLIKEEKHKLRYPVTYKGFAIHDEFVVGYGMDYRGYYRNLPYIGILDLPGK
ncbi:MAG: hypoxanthine phosphoribosyltransferase [Candidatus Hydrogenedentota bacterium]|nr:MAG: hypoxanthine phosphoribosyltransferase [Candidatus Hydrogenedentota bacterium]